MRGDMVVALGRAAADGATLLGHNAGTATARPFGLVRTPARDHAPGEVVRATYITLPEVRQVCAVLGARPAGLWGYVHGVSERGVAMGCTRLHTRLTLDGPGLTGPDLVRLTLERAHSALHATEVLTALIARHGQGAFPGPAGGEEADAAFLIADGTEAFLVEAAGRWWVWQEVHEARAVSDVCTIGQDWDGIAPGLSTLAIAHDWWPEDGTKLDFASAVGEAAERAGSAMRRWGRATLQLEEQSGHIDAAFLRRLLADHHEYFASDAERGPATASLVAQLSAVPVPLAWWALGTPHRSLWFPVPVLADLPLGLQGGDEEAGPLGLAARLGQLLDRGDRHRRARARAALEGLQAQFDSEVGEFATEALALKRLGDEAGLRRLATVFVHRCWEEFVDVCDSFVERAEPAVVEESLAVF